MALEVCAAVIFYDGKLLLTSRPEGKHYAGYWEFPGGKVEVGETLNCCMKREIKEELNLDVLVFDQVWTTYYSYDSKDVKINFMRCLITSSIEEMYPNDKQQNKLGLQ